MENYTLSITTYTLNVLTGKLDVDKEEITGCYVYKTGESYKDTWFATKMENPPVDPITILDSGEKIYQLKNWTKDNSNFRFKDEKFVLVIFDNNYDKEDFDLKEIKNQFNSYFPSIVVNLQKFKNEVIDKLGD